ncbi:tetratricopeptide repeat protein [Paraliomyxa miuraensis]|uniref:serine/threonine-protein kinase n=1 Tax=Paraliomyxa miuraensis TaxID=376150 RepID=UPI00224C86CA|nr:serine/threonine-protein kinase [Paraliomyxa miuraensis]MCX4247450.1 serine/threonine-protein kinase [Paraliomyxa miuraensis]
MPPNSETPTRDDEELLSSQHDRPPRVPPNPRRAKPLILSHRFILLGPLGSGGTSMVYKAYDPELDRKVAIKLLQGRRKAGHRGEERLIREAKAMAKLQHANVVTVFDVSRYEEPDLGLDPALDTGGLEVPPKGIFIVMELVEGGDLRRWLGRRHRQWREVLEVMLAAGQGLAAAHEMGIVHRDVKPGNVLIGDDGRVLMSDFGLARAAALRSPPSGGREHRWPSGSWDDGDTSDLTREGAVLGTPPYMSPEQHRGEGSDPRSDQFGFGVTLYEALFGVRPFSGTMTEMRRAKQQGRWRPVPSGSKVPSRVVAVLERSLQPDPEQRYASMTELLGALGQASRSRVPQRAFLGGIALVVSVAIPLALLGTDEDPCTGGQGRVEQAWSSERQEAIQDVFERSSAPYARAAGPRVKAEIDDWTRGWLAAYRDACEATHVRREQTPEALELRVSCLSRQIRELEAMTELMEGGDSRVVENAMVSVQSLGDVHTCDDVAALSARAEPPATPEARTRVSSGYGQIAEARALELGGRYEEAVGLARSVVEEADAVGYPPLRAAATHRMAAALGLMGDFYAAEEQLVEAIEAAERSRDEPTAADAWIDLVWVVGVEQPRPEEALRLARFAQAAVERLDDDLLRRAALDHNRGGVFYRLERYDEALTHYQRAYQVQYELLGDRHPLVAQTLNHIGNVLIMQERYDEARLKCEQALEIRRSTLGERHPRVAAPLNNLAELLGRKGDHQQALDHAQRALEIVEGTGRPEELIAWILVAREREKLGDHQGELDARRQVLALLDEHPSFDQSTRDEHRERVELLLVPRPEPVPELGSEPVPVPDQRSTG